MRIAGRLIGPFVALLVVACAVFIAAYYAVNQAQNGGHPIDWGDVITRAGPLVVGVAGVLLAFYQAWLSDHDRVESRKAAFQQRLYDKQLEAYFDLYVKLGQLNNDALNRLTNELSTTAHGEVPMTPDRRFALRGELLPVWQQFALAQQRWALVVPSRVASAMGHFESTLLAITAPPGKSARQYPQDLVTHVDPSMPLATAYSDAVRAMRAAVGTDPLSDAMLQAMGMPPDEQDLPKG
jgi:hypothetical protein